MTRTGTTTTGLAILREPTPTDRVLQRQGARRHAGDCQKQYGACQLQHAMLDYVTARYVMDRLDGIGVDNWQDQYVDRTDGSVRCGIGILVDGEWVWKWDVGTESDIESDKGSYSDAFKRAAVKWGIARDLYPDGKAKPRPASSPAPRPVPSPRGGGAAHTDGPWEGPVSFGKPPTDGHVRETPDGSVFGFVITEPIEGKERGRRNEVVAHGAFADALDFAFKTGKPDTAMVWGRLEMVPWDKDGKAMPPYRRIHAERVMTPDWTLPATQPVAGDSVAPGAAPNDLDDLPW